MRAVLFLSFLFFGCGSEAFCKRYCAEKLGDKCVVTGSSGVSSGDLGKYCLCSVGVKLPAQPKPEKEKWSSELNDL